MATKKVSRRFTTPVLTLKHIHAVEPDTKYGPTFQVTIEATKDVVAAMELLDPAFKGAIPYKTEGDVVTLKVKQKRYIVWYDKKNGGKKEEREILPVLLNSDNTPYTGTTNPWSGTTGEVALNVEQSKDNNGNPIVALRLVGIRFHDVKQGSDKADYPLFGGSSTKAEPDLDQPDDLEEIQDDDIPW